MFAPGQLVVCVNDAPEPELAHLPRHPLDVSKGAVYTVDRFFPAGTVSPWRDAITLHEKRGMSAVYGADRFRPLSPRSISIVESLMAPVNAPGKVTEPA